MKKALPACLITLFIFANPLPLWAAEFSISPVLIDVEVNPRDIVTKDITLKNESSQKITLYATVNEIAVDGGGEIKEFVSPAMSDRTNTVTSWLEIGRGRIEMEAGETKTVPLTIRMNPGAQAGEYHAFIGFVSTNKRPIAEALALAGEADGVIVKIALEEKTNELLRISSFLIDRFIFNKDKSSITIEIENSGESSATPNGEIIFYNSRGEEVSSMPVNSENISLGGGEKKTITAKVPFHEKLGRYKANLVLRYGKDQEAAVFDTTQFFMVPFPLLVALLVAIVLFSLFVTYLLRRAFYDELHEDEDHTVPLYVRSDREHIDKDHDIHITKS
ncbi:MAG: hypothetical protein KBB78_03195 [Candidatus Pacebacteria bacterium]|nr:hypothetical protein [Candidatus Paceibacterota bacterium]